MNKTLILLLFKINVVFKSILSQEKQSFKDLKGFLKISLVTNSTENTLDRVLLRNFRKLSIYKAMIEKHIYSYTFELLGDIFLKNISKPSFTGYKWYDVKYLPQMIRGWRERMGSRIHKSQFSISGYCCS